MGLIRIKYVSRFSRDMSPAAIDALVEHAQAKNASLGVTGILVTTGGLFYQIIEGPEADTTSLFNTIAADPRHADVLVLSRESATSRIFPDWSMRKLALGPSVHDRLEPLRELLPTILELRLRADQLTNTLERGILRELTGG